MITENAGRMPRQLSAQARPHPLCFLPHDLEELAFASYAEWLAWKPGNIDVNKWEGGDVPQLDVPMNLIDLVVGRDTLSAARQDVASP